MTITGVLPTTNGRGRGRGQGRRGRGSRRHGQSRSRDDGQVATPNWQRVDPLQDTPPASLPFTESTGPQINLSDSPEPVDFFYHFFDDHLLSMIVEETNQ